MNEPIKKCKRCKEKKILQDFERCDSCHDGHRNVCRDCRSKRKNELYYINHNRYLELNKKYRKAKPNKAREYRLKIKLEVMSHYCNSSPMCQHCGFTDIRALCIDHVNGDGAKHRRMLTSNKLETKPRDGGGFNTYLWLRRNHYPEGYQVLCFNCNQIKECKQRDDRIKNNE